MKIHKYSIIQLFKYLSIQVFKYSSYLFYNVEARDPVGSKNGLWTFSTISSIWEDKSSAFNIHLVTDMRYLCTASGVVTGGLVTRYIVLWSLTFYIEMWLTYICLQLLSLSFIWIQLSRYIKYQGEYSTLINIKKYPFWMLLHSTIKEFNVLNSMKQFINSTF